MARKSKITHIIYFKNGWIAPWRHDTSQVPCIAFAVKSKRSMTFDEDFIFEEDFVAIMAVLEEDENLEDHFDKEVQEVWVYGLKKKIIASEFLGTLCRSVISVLFRSFAKMSLDSPY